MYRQDLLKIIETLVSHLNYSDHVSREDIQENVIQQNSQQLLRWLEDQEMKGEEIITLAQFCDMLMLRPGVGREEAIRVGCTGNQRVVAH